MERASEVLGSIPHCVMGYLKCMSNFTAILLKVGGISRQDNNSSLCAFVASYRTDYYVELPFAITFVPENLLHNTIHVWHDSLGWSFLGHGWAASTTSRATSSPCTACTRFLWYGRFQSSSRIRYVYCTYCTSFQADILII